MDKILSCFSAAIVFCIFLFVSGLQCEADLHPIPINTGNSSDTARFNTDTGFIHGDFGGVTTVINDQLNWRIDGQWESGTYIIQPTEVNLVDSDGKIKIDIRYQYGFNNQVRLPTADYEAEPDMVSIVKATMHWDSLNQAIGKGLAENITASTWTVSNSLIGSIWTETSFGGRIFNGSYVYEFDQQNLLGHLYIAVDYDDWTKLSKRIDPTVTVQQGVDSYTGTVDFSIYSADSVRHEGADGAEIRGSGTGALKYGFVEFQDLSSKSIANGTTSMTLGMYAQTVTAGGEFSLYQVKQELPAFYDSDSTGTSSTIYPNYDEVHPGDDEKWTGGSNFTLVSDLVDHASPIETITVSAGSQYYHWNISAAEVFGPTGTVRFAVIASTNANVSFDARNGTYPPFLEIEAPSVSGLNTYATNPVNSNNSSDIFRTVETRFVTEQIFTINEDDYTPSDDFTPHVTMSVQYRDEYLTTELTEITQERTISNSTPAIAFSTTFPATPGAIILSVSASTQNAGDLLFQKNITLLSGGGGSSLTLPDIAVAVNEEAAARNLSATPEINTLQYARGIGHVSAVYVAPINRTYIRDGNITPTLTVITKSSLEPNLTFHLMENGVTNVGNYKMEASDSFTWSVDNATNHYAHQYTLDSPFTISTATADYRFIGSWNINGVDEYFPFEQSLSLLPLPEVDASDLFTDSDSNAFLLKLLAANEINPQRYKADEEVARTTAGLSASTSIYIPAGRHAGTQFELDSTTYLMIADYAEDASDHIDAWFVVSDDVSMLEHFRTFDADGKISSGTGTDFN